MSVPSDSNAAADAQPAASAHPRVHLLGLASNVISLVGLLCVGGGLVLLLTFGLFVAVFPETNPYVDIVGLLIVPLIFVAGLVLVPLGMVWTLWRRRRRAARRGVPPEFPQLDLNDRRTRVLAGGFLAFSLFVVLPVLAVSSYYGYHYTESTEFCGQVCHSVMEPQATAHANSPHARVSCAACHIGTGASWFVKSKLSGLRQVLAVWRDSYSRPIPPAITELRPARETCEQCHWPAKFFGVQFRELVHYAPDEANTRRTVRMLLKTGGADPTLGRVEGIHMHMVLAGQIEFVASDPHLQEIPWVRYVTDDGTELIYRSDGAAPSAPPPPGLVRRIDCMDCHNRGAHHFLAPHAAVNLDLDAGRVDPTLPFVQREAVAALTAGYPDVPTAVAAIETRLRSFYAENYPAVARERAAAIDAAIAAVQELYRRTFFPEMKVSWQTYPENVGHLNSPGCFRCHDGRHINQHGVAISSDCDVCHTFLNPLAHSGPAAPGGPAATTGPAAAPGGGGRAPDGRALLGPGQVLVEGEFRHSMDLVQHGGLRCDQCHTGGPLPLCRDCHASGEWLDQRGRELFQPRPR